MDGKQFAILRQGAEVWNDWRGEHAEAFINLKKAVLRGRLDYVDFSDIRLPFVSAEGTSFRYASFDGAYINSSDFGDADFRDAQLYYAVFEETRLDGARFADAGIAFTKFLNVDLSRCVELHRVLHGAPSTIGIDTLRLSRGLIPEPFLRGCGLSDVEIEFAKLYRENLTSEEVTDITYRIHELRGTRPIQLSPVFISYAHKDAAFVDELEKRLNANGIRFWRDIHDLKAGRLETQIDRAIRLNPVVVLVLSQHSVESDWVEYEASKARALEKELKRDVLCPVALDDSWKSCAWPGPLRRQIEDYNILDFSTDIDGQFAKLKEGLGLFYAKPT